MNHSGSNRLVPKSTGQAIKQIEDMTVSRATAHAGRTEPARSLLHTHYGRKHPATTKSTAQRKKDNSTILPIQGADTSHTIHSRSAAYRIWPLSPSLRSIDISASAAASAGAYVSLSVCMRWC